MKLHQALVSQGALYNDIAKALPEPSTVVFSDTSVLFWLFNLGKTARGEFIDWIEDDIAGLAGRFKVPVWGAHELHEHMRTNPGKLTPLAGEIKAVSSSMRELRRIISLFADEVRRPNLLDRREYISELERVGDRFTALCNMAGTQQPWAQLSKEIVPFINRHVLASDIFPALRWIQGDYSARAIGRVPPGFKDDKKPENRFGDLMLWSEIVNYCKETAEVTTAILLTDDNKTDWVFRPQTVLDELGDPHPNKKNEGYETLLAPPLLAHELATVSNIEQFYIVNTSALAIVLERYAGRSIPALFAAVQPLLPSPRQPSLVKPAATQAPSGTAQTSPTAAVRPTLPPLTSLRRPEEEITTVMPALVPVLASLRSRDPGLQESAFKVIEHDGLPAAPAAAFFTLGRAISEATRTELQTASSFVHRFETATAMLSEEARLALFAGVLFDLYFDSEGKPRPLPLSGDVEAAFEVSTIHTLKPAVSAVEALLNSHRAHYLATPGNADRKLSLAFSLTRTPRGGPSELSQIRHGRTELLEDLAEGADDLLTSWVSSANAGTISDMLSAIARRFSVPLDWLISDQPGESQVFWAETKGFKEL